MRKRTQTMLTVGYFYLPILMAIPAPVDYTTPYVITLFGLVIAFAALLVFFPFMRKYRRKRNILVYVVALIIIGLLVFQINEAPNWSKRALVEYVFAGDQKYNNRTDNQFAIACDNFGDKPAKFYINCTAFNASLQVKTEQDYVQVSNTMVKVPFFLQERGQPSSGDRKQVFFSVDENATEFEFTFWLEELSSPLIPTYGDYAMRYTWNSTENCFVQSSGASFT